MSISSNSSLKKKKKKKKIAEIGTAEHDKSEEQREVDLTRIEIEKIRGELIEKEISLKISEKEIKTLREQLDISNHKIKEMEQQISEFQSYFKITEKELENENFGQVKEFTDEDFQDQPTDLDQVYLAFEKQSSLFDDLVKSQDNLLLSAQRSTFDHSFLDFSSLYHLISPYLNHGENTQKK